MGEESCNILKGTTQMSAFWGYSPVFLQSRRHSCKISVSLRLANPSIPPNSSSCSARFWTSPYISFWPSPVSGSSNFINIDNTPFATRQFEPTLNFVLAAILPTLVFHTSFRHSVSNFPLGVTSFPILTSGPYHWQIVPRSSSLSFLLEFFLFAKKRWFISLSVYWDGERIKNRTERKFN